MAPDLSPVPPGAVTDDGTRDAVHAAAEAIRSLSLPPEAIEAAGIIAGTAVINATPHLLRAAAPAIRADERERIKAGLPDLIERHRTDLLYAPPECREEVYGKLLARLECLIGDPGA